MHQFADVGGTQQLRQKQSSKEREREAVQSELGVIGGDSVRIRGDARGYSPRIFVQTFRHERQSAWFDWPQGGVRSIEVYARAPARRIGRAPRARTSSIGYA